MSNHCRICGTELSGVGGERNRVFYRRNYMTKCRNGYSEEEYHTVRDQRYKADAGKERISLVPTNIIRDIARIREYGLMKYGEAESWRSVEPERYIDAMLRHALLFSCDPTGLDEESGLPHLWHIACNCAFLCEMLDGSMNVPNGAKNPSEAKERAERGIR